MAEFALWTTHWTDPAEVRDEVVLVESGRAGVPAQARGADLLHLAERAARDDLDPIVPGGRAATGRTSTSCAPSVPPVPPPALPDFDAMYTADDDPWDVETSWYERRKLAVLLATLPREHYARAWEPGCGPGVVSAPARRPGRRAGRQRRVDGRGRRWPGGGPGTPPHVRFVRSELPEVPLDGPVDLLVVAEFLYYVARPAGRARRPVVGVRAGHPGGVPALGAPPARRAPRRPGDARPDLPRQPASQRRQARSATSTRTSCSTSTRCRVTVRAAGAEVRSSVDGDARRRTPAGRGARTTCGPGRSRTSRTR